MSEEATSRLCVKNLPIYVDESRLREHFSEKGEVTDAKVIRAGDGHSRQFGFIGFKTVDDATAALEYFNNSYLDTSRLTIQYAYQRGASEAPRPWSKYSTGTSAHAKLHPDLQPDKKSDKQKRKKGKGSKVDEGESDEKLQEFLQVMQPRRKTTIWSNDTSAVDTTRSLPGQLGQQKQEATTAHRGEAGGNSSDEDEELYEDLPAAAAKHRSAGEESSEEEQGEEPAAADPAVADAGVSALEYLKSRMRGSFSDEEEAEPDAQASGSEGEADSDEEAAGQSAGTGTADGEDAVDADGDAELVEEDASDERRQRSGEEAGAAPQVVEASDAVSAIAETGRLFLRNLSYAATEDDLTQLLQPYGELQEVHLVLDKATKRSKGIALVQFVEASEAVEAHAALDGIVFQGRLLHILPGHRPPVPKPSADDTQLGAGGFKAQREQDRRANAGQRSAWNSLFMRQDTVADAVAAHLGVTKAELLDPEAPDMAVRQALGETQVIANTKTALGDAGVAIEKMEEAAMAAGKAADSRAVARSQTVLLVKNLPYSVTETELQDMFGRFGEIGRLVLPETHVLALVEYLEAADARRAFKGLAYRRLQHVPLYLEWAPAGIFSGPVFAPQAQSAAAKAGAAGADAADVPATVGLAPDDAEAEPHTLFVKNLAWKTGDAALRKHFDKAASSIGGACRSAKVAMRQDKKGPDGKPLSMGFGFVECSSEDVAKTVMRQLQGTMLDGHKLAIQLSQRKRLGSDMDKTKAKDAEKTNNTKLVVRNVAFEGTRKDIVGLFGPYGHIKSARLPRKFDGTHRGFAFVEFASKQEAQAAVEAVAGTHLYGRRLVVEWADDESGLDELRVKTAAKFHDDDEAATARPRKQRKAAAS